MTGNSSKRITVKIGSNSISNTKSGLSCESLELHCAAIAELINDKHQVVLVSSGAISAGYKKVGYSSRPTTTVGKQAAAALGQGLLMQAYAEAFKEHGILVAQILMTQRDFAYRVSYNNALNTISELLKRKVLPIINENDTVAVDELTFSDNDMLAALVATLLHCDLLIMLTSTDGLYAADPQKNPTAERYDYIPELTSEFISQLDNSKSPLGTGGMRSKVGAAQLALSLGVPSFIGRLHSRRDLCKMVNGEGHGTYIGAKGASALDSKKQWIAYHSEPTGKIIVDKGAALALLADNKSLLPAGVKEVYGDFGEGSVVEVFNDNGELIGKGIVNYGSKLLIQAQGQSTEHARQVLKIIRPEIIHRDNWVCLALGACGTGS